MKVLLVNYHYFIHGGPDRYFFNVKNLLENAGHTVIPFCFDYDETNSTPYQEYFPDPISGRGTYLIENIKLTGIAMLAYLKKMFYNKDVESKFTLLMHREKPDLVYTIYLSSSMLPKILYIAKHQFKIPVIYRLSDFHMFCASYLFFRNGEVCQECLKNKCAAIKHQCVKSSAFASFLRVLQIEMINKKKWYESVDCFICPSQTMERRLIDAGFKKDRVRHIPTFSDDMRPALIESGPYILYYGNISREKGADVLIMAYNKIVAPALPLKLVGYCSDSYKSHLLSLVAPDRHDSVMISPPLHGELLWDTLHNSTFVVHPAMCYENMPNTLIEAFSAGKPVIASDIGSLSELVQHGENGYLCPPGDVQALSSAMHKMMEDTDLKAMGANSRRRYEKHHTPAAHLDSLQNLFEEVATYYKNRVSE